jgi:hypothetical protein
VSFIRAGLNRPHWLGRGALLLILMALAASAFLAVELYRMRALAHAPLLRSQFSHTDHRRTSCPVCHHNFTDKTGKGSCYNCHKKEMLNGITRIDVLFHDFCMGCHLEERSRHRSAGPVKTCSLCHTLDPPSAWTR